MQLSVASSEYTEASEGDTDDFVDDYVSATELWSYWAVCSVYVQCS